MGWFEKLSGSNQEEGARNASVAEEVEVKRYREHNPALKSDESLKWKGGLFTGYHLCKTDKNGSTEYIKSDKLPDKITKINT
jgi:hypothetical protein